VGVRWKKIAGMGKIVPVNGGKENKENGISGNQQERLTFLRELR